jgi:hypothetical protein|tara:strand:+ start:3073 stop:4242 length:1170 start_codon:yes stop_codon:yes gene_type:complete
MAKKEEPIVDSETGSLKVKEKVAKQPEGNETKGDVTKVKAKMKMKAEVESEEPIKVDLSKPPEEKTAEEVKPEVEVQEEVQAEAGTLEEVNTEEVEEVADVASAAIEESMTTGNPLPDNVQKLVDFMEETGGDLNDYVQLNKDYSEVDNQTVLQEYYKQTKPHLDAEEINFLMEDQFSFDEDVDEDREIKRKKLALKEQVANAKSHLEETKSKYYADLKGGSKLTEEQQEAVKFFSESKKNEQLHKNATTNFLNKTNRFFGDKFKGFEYNVGDKNFRFNVNDVNKVKDTQSDINNFIGKFLDEKGAMADEAGYHKSLFTAMNSDAVAKHFYEQGKSDALKQSITDSKNINMDPRQELGENKNTGGMQVKVLGDTTADFKFKIKNNKFKN